MSIIDFLFRIYNLQFTMSVSKGSELTDLKNKAIFIKNKLSEIDKDKSNSPNEMFIKSLKKDLLDGKFDRYASQGYDYAHIKSYDLSDTNGISNCQLLSQMYKTYEGNHFRMYTHAKWNSLLKIEMELISFFVKPN